VQSPRVSYGVLNHDRRLLRRAIVGAGGAIVPTSGYFDKVQAVLRKYDVLFVADEVIRGLPRTGEM
jgi:adenosylmethionine-8-amino-7-oxononanoate aminotransferase